MPNLRILYDNLADTTSSITASNTAGSLSIDNVKTEIKSHVHRSTGTSVSYTANWATDQVINCVVLPCTNLSATATIRVRFYDSVDAELFDSTAVTAVPGWNLNLGTRIFNANLFAFGYTAKTAVYSPTDVTGVRKVIIDLADSSNIAGYIDCSRILIGKYWESTFNVENGIQLQTIDGSIISRTNAGELVADLGFIYDKVAFNFALIPEVDRTELAKIIRSVGTTKNFFISVLPEYTSETAEQDFMVYGKRSNSALSYKTFGFYNHSMEITSW